MKPMPPENLLLLDVDCGIEFEKLENASLPFDEERVMALIRSSVMEQIVERI